jgi:UDP-glucose 4-epimerase
MIQSQTNPRIALITGASGQLGFLLVQALNELGWNIFAVSRSNSFSHLSNVTHIPHDWNKPITFDIPKVDTIFHLAAQTSAYKAREDIVGDVNANVTGTVNLLEQVARSGTKPAIIYTGSLTEYGMTPSVLIDEKTPLSPQTFYDAAKIATQVYLNQFVHEGWLSKSVTLRLSNVYGNSIRIQGADRGFIDRSIFKASKGEPLTYFGSGEYLRDFIHTDDVVSALIASALNLENLLLPAFNIGTGVSTSIKSSLELIAKEAESLTGRSVEICQADFDTTSYAIEKRNSTADSKSFQQLTGWQPKITLNSGVRRSLGEAFSIITPK